MAEESLLQKLNGVIQDLSSLEVATFGPKDGDTLDLDLNFTDDDGKAVTSNQVFNGIRTLLAKKELVGYVRFEIDGDTVAFVNNDQKYDSVLEYHKEIIKAAQSSRKAVYDTIVGLK